jgi:hypothetical protein
MATLLLTGVSAQALAAEPSAQAQQRAKAVTQVVLGILSYARWPAEPNPCACAWSAPPNTPTT